MAKKQFALGKGKGRILCLWRELCLDLLKIDKQIADESAI